MSSGSPAADDATSVRDPLIGTRLGDYQVVGPLGEGGMGVVYEGLHTVINKRVAIKVIKPEFAADQVLSRRVVAEAQAVNAVRHRGIVDIHAHGLTPDGRPYLVMEMLHGETLSDLLDREGQLSLVEATKLIFEATGPLFAAHKAGIVHRDLKPSNLFLCKDDDGERFLKLLDFGLAKRSAPGVTSSTMTSASLIVGTPDYMAPEQARAQPTDMRTDIYSLGVLAFELLMGRLPYSAGSSVDLVMQHLTAPVPRLVDLDPSIPVELSQLVEQMMAKEPAKRPQSLEPVRARLKGLLASGLPARSPLNRATPALATPALLSPVMDLNQGSDPPPELPPAERTVITEAPTDDGTADTAMSLKKIEARPSRRKLHDEKRFQTTDVGAAIANRTSEEPAFVPPSEDSARPPKASRTPLIIGASLAVVIAIGLVVVFASSTSQKTVVSTPVDEPPPALEPVPVKPVDAKPPDVKPSDAKPADVKPSDAKPADAKPADVKPTDAKPTDAKPTDAKPADVKPTDVKKPVDVKKPDGKKPRDPKPAKPVPTVEELKSRIDALEEAAKGLNNSTLKLLFKKYRGLADGAKTEADRQKLANDLEDFRRTQLK